MSFTVVRRGCSFAMQVFSDVSVKPPGQGSFARSAPPLLVAVETLPGVQALVSFSTVSTSSQTVSDTAYCGAVQSAGKVARAVASTTFLKLFAGVAASSPKEQVDVHTGVVVKEAVTRQVKDESEDSESRQRQRVRVVAGPSSQPLRQTRSE